MKRADVDPPEARGYQPVKASEGFNPHVKRHAIIWVIASAVFVPACVYLLDCSMYLDPADPTLNQLRYAVIKITGFIMAIFGLSGFVIFMEAVTNGNLIGRAIETSEGASRFLAALVVATAAILVWI